MSADADLASAELYELLGMDPDDYEAAMAAGRNTVGWRGMPATEDPRWHSHPALGITGHSHSRTEDARRPHGHRPVVDWDCTPVFFADPRPACVGKRQAPMSDRYDRQDGCPECGVTVGVGHSDGCSLYRPSLRQPPAATDAQAVLLRVTGERDEAVRASEACRRILAGQGPYSIYQWADEIVHAEPCDCDEDNESAGENCMAGSDWCYGVFHECGEWPLLVAKLPRRMPDHDGYDDHEPADLRGCV